MAHAVSVALTVDAGDTNLGHLARLAFGRCARRHHHHDGADRRVHRGVLRFRSSCGTATPAGRLFTALASDSPVPQDVLDAAQPG